MINASHLADGLRASCGPLEIRNAALLALGRDFRMCHSMISESGKREGGASVFVFVGGKEGQLERNSRTYNYDTAQLA